MFDFLGDDPSKWVELITQVVGVFALVATLTPNSTDNSIMDWIMKLINFLGANIGKASNSD